MRGRQGQSSRKLSLQCRVCLDFDSFIKFQRKRLTLSCLQTFQRCYDGVGLWETTLCEKHLFIMKQSERSVHQTWDAILESVRAFRMRLQCKLVLTYLYFSGHGNNTYLRSCEGIAGNIKSSVGSSNKLLTSNNLEQSRGLVQPGFSAPRFCYWKTIQTIIQLDTAEN